MFRYRAGLGSIEYHCTGHELPAGAARCMQELLAFWEDFMYNKLIHFKFFYEVMLCI